MLPKRADSYDLDPADESFSSSQQMSKENIAGTN